MHTGDNDVLYMVLLYTKLGKQKNMPDHSGNRRNDLWNAGWNVSVSADGMFSACPVWI